MKKTIALTLTLILSLTVLTSRVFAEVSVPRLQIVNQPRSEYKAGETISFTVSSPNYSGKVEYRVMLYNGTTKKTTELWNTKNTGYYYKNWQPAGNYNFTIHWPVKGMEPGAYSLTVLVRRVGANVPYDSHIDTRTVWIKDSNNTTAIDKKFIGDGTEKRVEQINARHTYNYFDKSKKLYFTNLLSLSAKNPYPNTKFSKYYRTINDHILYFRDMETLPHIYTTDNKDYVMFLGFSSNMERYIKDDIDRMRDNGVFDGNPHNFEVYLYEVFYDKNTGEYYVANEVHTELLNATAKEVAHKKGEVSKYLAVPVQIADF